MLCLSMNPKLARLSTASLTQTAVQTGTAVHKENTWATEKNNWSGGSLTRI
jgi:hypothetical protein